MNLGLSMCANKRPHKAKLCFNNIIDILHLAPYLSHSEIIQFRSYHFLTPTRFARLGSSSLNLFNDLPLVLPMLSSCVHMFISHPLTTFLFLVYKIKNKNWALHLRSFCSVNASRKPVALWSSQEYPPRVWYSSQDKFPRWWRKKEFGGFHEAQNVFRVAAPVNNLEVFLSFFELISTLGRGWLWNVRTNFMNALYRALVLRRTLGREWWEVENENLDSKPLKWIY
jgi:hypothetical protein